MKKFVVDLFSNRFGIILATLNVCYFVNKLPVLFDFPRNLSGKIFISLNSPALISSGLSYEIVKNFLFEPAYEPRLQIISVFIVGFIFLQWLFIAWIARAIAAKFRPKEL